MEWVTEKNPIGDHPLYLLPSNYIVGRVNRQKRHGDDLTYIEKMIGVINKKPKRLDTVGTSRN